MGNELREAIVIGLELIVFSFLLIIIAFFGSYSKTALHLKNVHDSTRTDIVEYNNIYNFTLGSQVTVAELQDMGIIDASNNLQMSRMDEGLAGGFANSTIVTGNDLVNFYGKFGKEYNGVAKLADGRILDNTDFSSNALGDISLQLGEHVNSEYYCFAIYDEYKYQYAFVVFYEKTV